MLKLLRSNFSRFVKSKTVWLCLALQAAILLFMMSVSLIQRRNDHSYAVQSEVYLLTVYGVFGIPLQGIMISLFGCLFIGADYNGGSLRNKLIMGHSRSSIYLANYITVAVFALLLNFVGLLISFALGLPLFGKFRIASKLVVWIVIDGTALMLAYSALVTIVAMLSRNTTVSVITCLIALVVAMFTFMMISDTLSEPETVTVITYNSLGEPIEKITANPQSPSKAVRALYQFCLDFFPSGQTLQLSKGENFHDWQMLVYSLVIAASTTTAGCLVFRKLDVK